MQSSSSSTSRTSTTGTTGTTGTYSAGVEQRLNEMGTGAERVVTNPSIPDSQARQPVQEYTEFIEKQKIQQPTSYSTQQRVMEQHEAPIRLKEQEIQQVEKKNVIQEQPVIVRKQEVQVEKERPIQVVKETTQHQTLPAIEKKEVIVQPVQHTPEAERTVMKTTTEGGAPVQYNVTAEESAARQIETGKTHKHDVVEHIKETVGGAKAAAHGIIETAREKAREVFHTSGTKDKTMTETESTTSSTMGTSNVQQGTTTGTTSYGRS